jgi:hypothetical protein
MSILFFRVESDFFMEGNHASKTKIMTFITFLNNIGHENPLSKK